MLMQACVGGLSWAEVEARLVEAARVWRALESGRWPFASDGPWHMFVRERGDWGWLDERADRWERGARLRPSRAEIGAAEEAVGWLRLVPERDRRLVVLAVTMLATGESRVPWRRLLPLMGLKLGEHGLRRRYDRAIQSISQALGNRVDR